MLEVLFAWTTLAQAELWLAASRFAQHLARIRLVFAASGSLGSL